MTEIVLRIDRLVIDRPVTRAERAEIAAAVSRELSRTLVAGPDAPAADPGDHHRGDHRLAAAIAGEIAATVAPAVRPVVTPPPAAPASVAVPSRQAVRRQHRGRR